MYFVPFHPQHLDRFVAQPTQQADTVAVGNAYVHMLAGTLALSGFHEGRCVGCAGIVPMFPHRGIAWALFSDTLGEHVRPIVRKVRFVLETSPYTRVETAVSALSPKAIRFAEAVGLRRETPEPLMNHGPNGEPEYIYARVR